MRCKASVRCKAGSSSNSEAVYECPAKSSKWSKAPILLQSDSAVDWISNCIRKATREMGNCSLYHITEKYTSLNLSYLVIPSDNYNTYSSSHTWKHSISHFLSRWIKHSNLLLKYRWKCKEKVRSGRRNPNFKSAGILKHKYRKDGGVALLHKDT